jgi:hypothetical protein
MLSSKKHKERKIICPLEASFKEKATCYLIRELPWNRDTLILFDGRIFRGKNHYERSKNLTI